MTAVNDPLAPLSEQDHIDRIWEIAQRVKAAKRDLHTAVWDARHAKPRAVTWQLIADAIGISRQAAAERFTTRRRSR